MTDPSQPLPDADYAKQAQDAYQNEWAFRKQVTDHQILERRKRNATFGDYLADVPAGAVEGGVQAIASVGDLADRVTGGSGGSASPLSGITSNTWTGNLSSGIAQFATAYYAPGNIAGAVGKAYQLGKVGRAGLGLAAGGVADFTGFTGEGGRLSDLIEEHPILANPISKFLSSKPDDTWAERRLKGALEGMGLGLATEVLLHSLRGVRATNALETAKTPELRDYLEKQIADSQQKLGDAIGAMESGEGAARASRMLDVLGQDATDAEARQAAVEARSSGVLEDGGSRIIPEGERIQNAPEAPASPPMDVTQAFESKGVRAPGLDVQPTAVPEPGPNQMGRSYEGPSLTPPDAPTVKFTEGHNAANVLC